MTQCSYCGQSATNEGLCQKHWDEENYITIHEMKMRIRELETFGWLLSCEVFDFLHSSHYGKVSPDQMIKAATALQSKIKPKKGATNDT